MEHPVFQPSSADIVRLEKVLEQLRRAPDLKIETLYGNLTHLAVRMLRAAHKRKKVFIGLDHLFGDPGWDILLCLYASRRPDKMSISDVNAATEAPGTTVLRYLSALTRAGIIEKSPDWQDRRRTFVSLTDRGQALMDQYLVTVEW